MKLKNKYTRNKDYFSYEKDYLYEVKRVINSCPYYSNPYEIINAINELINRGENINEDIMYQYILLGSFIENFPVYYVHDSFIELAYKTGIKTGISLSNPFIEKAVFLYPKHNSLRIMFSVLFYLHDRIISYHRFSSPLPLQLAKTVHLTNNILYGNEISDEDFTNLFLNSTRTKISDPINTQVFLLIANIFLYMSAYKEKGMKIIKEHFTNNIGFKQGKSKLLTPPTIGFSEEEYVKNQHRLVSVSNPDLQGIKKQTHWRRGHWRQYDDGKLTWVRPCIINPCEV